MFVRPQVDGVVDPLNNIRAVAGQQRGDVDMAFLQILVWIELIERALQLAVRGFIAGHLRANETRAESIELILDFLPARVERARERGIHGLLLVA